MAKPGDVLVDSVAGERYVFLETGRETDGELLRVDDFVEAGLGPRPSHMHPRQEERFKVRKGRMSVRVDGEEHVLGAGDEFVIPPGTTHSNWNSGEEELHLTIELRPALRFEAFLEAVTGLSEGGNRGVHYLLLTAMTMRRFKDEIRPTRMPLPVERTIFGALSGIGKLFGHKLPSEAAKNASRGAEARIEATDVASI